MKQVEINKEIQHKLMMIAQMERVAFEGVFETHKKRLFALFTDGSVIEEDTFNIYALPSELLNKEGLTLKELPYVKITSKSYLNETLVSPDVKESIIAELGEKYPEFEAEDLGCVNLEWIDMKEHQKMGLGTLVLQFIEERMKDANIELIEEGEEYQLLSICIECGKQECEDDKAVAFFLDANGYDLGHETGFKTINMTY